MNYNPCLVSKLLYTSEHVSSSIKSNCKHFSSWLYTIVWSHKKDLWQFYSNICQNEFYLSFYMSDPITYLSFMLQNRYNGVGIIMFMLYSQRTQNQRLNNLPMVHGSLLQNLDSHPELLRSPINSPQVLD